MDELACIFTKLELKNATLTAENTRMQKELEAEHALAETLGNGLEQAKDENVKLRELIDGVHESLCADRVGMFHRLILAELEDGMRELGIEVEE